MSYIVVITFENAEEAGQVREALHEVESGGYLSLDDSAVVVRDEEGKIHVHNELDRGVKIGAVGGGFLGLFVGVLLAPLGGLILGAIAGALVGSLFDMGISKSFVKDVQESLTPGTSAIFFVIREGNPNVALAALKPYKGQVYHTSLPPEGEENLRRILSKRTVD